MEYLLFKKEIVLLRFPEIINIININNYLKDNILVFNKEFSNK